MEILYRRPICHGTLYLSESAVKKKNENICKYFQQSQPHRWEVQCTLLGGCPQAPPSTEKPGKQLLPNYLSPCSNVNTEKKQMYNWEGGSITSQTKHTVHSVEVCHFLARLKKGLWRYPPLNNFSVPSYFRLWPLCYRVQYVQTHDLSKVETRPHGRFIKSYFGAASKDVVPVLWILSRPEKRGIFRPLFCSGL